MNELDRVRQLKAENYSLKKEQAEMRRVIKVATGLICFMLGFIIYITFIQ